MHATRKFKLCSPKTTKTNYETYPFPLGNVMLRITYALELRSMRDELFQSVYPPLEPSAPKQKIKTPWTYDQLVKLHFTITYPEKTFLRFKPTIVVRLILILTYQRLTVVQVHIQKINVPYFYFFFFFIVILCLCYFNLTAPSLSSSSS